MNPIEFPAALAVSAWERGTVAAKTRPAALADGLKGIKRLYDAIDFALFDVARVGDVAMATERAKQIDLELERRVKPLQTLVRTVCSVAGKWISDLKKVRPPPAPAIAATDAAARAAETLGSDLGDLGAAAKAQLARRLAELEAARSAAAAKGKPALTPQRLRLRSKLKEGFNVVKNRPDRQVNFVVCAGNRECLPHLGPVAGSTQKALLKTVMKGDTGLKFYFGRCVYEESCYTFIGVNMPTGLRKRLEIGLRDLTGSVWRVRVKRGNPADIAERK